MAALSALVGALALGGCGAGAIDAEQSAIALAEPDAGGSVSGDAGNVRADAGALQDGSVALPPATPNDGGSAQPTPSDAGSSASATAKTLHTQGRHLLDTCGQPFVARGMEQITAKAFSPDNTLATLAAELVQTGSNAVRLLPTEEVNASDLDALLGRLAAARVVVYLSPGDRAWFSRADIREVLLRHESGIILDAFQEPDYDDVTRWLRETKAAIAELRAAGYVCPLTVLSAQFGRDLSTALEHGQEVVDSDPQHNVIVGWQAYWGKSGWYQGAHDMSLAQGVEACANQGFPMQVGIDLFADANDEMDYKAVMAAAQQRGIGWLWWNFWNQWDGMGNNASRDGTADNLTPAGEAVLRSDANSIARTAQKACFR